MTDKAQGAAATFRKKPVEIEAMQWTGNNLVNIIEFTDGRKPDNRHDFAAMKWDEYTELVKRDGLKIFTLEGKMNADVGDWIIKGVKGEFYPCKPDIFELTYECAALKAQPALTEAMPKLVIVQPAYERQEVVIASDEMLDGERLVCVVIRPAPTEAQGDVLAGYTKWMHDSSKYPHSDDMRHPFEAFKAGTQWAQLSGNSGELAQGEDSARLDAELDKQWFARFLLSQTLHNVMVGNQSAWIEWQHGAGAETAMQWIENGLVGPGLIPQGTDPQLWFNANVDERMDPPPRALASAETGGVKS